MTCHAPWAALKGGYVRNINCIIIIIICVMYIEHKVVRYCHYDDFTQGIILFAHKTCKINILIEI